MCFSLACSLVFFLSILQYNVATNHGISNEARNVICRFDHFPVRHPVENEANRTSKEREWAGSDQ